MRCLQAARQSDGFLYRAVWLLSPLELLGSTLTDSKLTCSSALQELASLEAQYNSSQQRLSQQEQALQRLDQEHSVLLSQEQEAAGWVATKHPVMTRLPPEVVLPLCVSMSRLALLAARRSLRSS